MISTKFQKTAQTPSFGMSAYGQTSGTRVEFRAIAPAAGVQVSTCARIRQTGGAMGLVAVKGDFPGTSAWRPPSC